MYKKSLIKLLVSLGLVVLICWQIDFQEFTNNLQLISLKIIFVTSLLYILGQVISSIKWQIFLKKTTIQKKLWTLIHVYFLGMFINTFGLGTVGGDLARALLLKPDPEQRLAAFSSVIADRIHGLVVLLIFGAIAVLIIQPEIFNISTTILNFLASIGIFCAIFGWFYLSQILVFCSKFSQKLKGIVVGLTLTFRLTHLDLLKATVLSVSMHTLHIFIYYLLAKSLGVEVNFSYFCVVVPIVNVASSLPISINGIGIRESLLILLLAEVQVAAATAALLGVLFTVIVTIISGLGGLVGSRKIFS
ncbi:MAG: flippase-like domain-containing protein [Deltaproteobacteria bacterium]|nr:flippase-like domain-containing protein [Deltaproteobacteria bacterium]